MLGNLVAGRATGPLRAVAETAGRILATGDLAARVPGATGTGELAELVRQLNTLLERNAVHVRGLSEMLDNLAHDLRTPLTRLRGAAELALQDGGDPAEARAALASCIEETDRLLHLLEVLLDVSAAEAGVLRLHRESIDLGQLAQRYVDRYPEVAEWRTIRVRTVHTAPVGDRVGCARSGSACHTTPD